MDLPTNPDQFLFFFAKEIHDQPILNSEDLGHTSMKRHAAEDTA